MQKSLEIDLTRPEAPKGAGGLVELRGRTARAADPGDFDESSAVFFAFSPGAGPGGGLRGRASGWQY